MYHACSKVIVHVVCSVLPVVFCPAQQLLRPEVKSFSAELETPVQCLP